ncbi:MAG: cyclase family protein [Chloroflexi bacterium]|nr:cyclase family protein [Chloroflexota bacterium]MBI2980159.1 cyclase family protein [Chloroflexota bacterium]
MKIIDLTAPLYNGQPGMYGFGGCRTAPTWPEPFKATETMSYNPDGMRFNVYTIFCEPGTRFILPSFRKDYKDDVTLDTVDINKTILRDAVVIDVPKGDDEIVQADELEAAFKKAPVKKGDALIIRTGWGDNQRYFKIGRLYQENSPHFNNASAEKLMELMQKNGSDLWTYDVESMNGLDKKSLTRGGFTIRAGMVAIGGVVNCGAITKPRVKLIAAGLKAKGGHMSPCTVVAIEE